MSFNRKEKERKDRKQLIIDTALYVFSDLGIENTTIDEIAKQAGFGKATLYYYYQSKDEIYNDIIMNGWQKLWDEVEDDVVCTDNPKKKVFRILNTISKVINRNNNLYKFLLEAPVHMQKADKQDWKTYQSRIYSILETVIEQGCNDGDFIDLEPSIIMKAIGGLFHELLIGSKNVITESDFELMISNLILAKKPT